MHAGYGCAGRSQTHDQDEIQDGSNQAVIANARQDLPMLKMHLRLSEAAYRSVK